MNPMTVYETADSMKTEDGARFTASLEKLATARIAVERVTVACPGDIPDGEVWAGNPARFIKKRT